MSRTVKIFIVLIVGAIVLYLVWTYLNKQTTGKIDINATPGGLDSDGDVVPPKPTIAPPAGKTYAYVTWAKQWVLVACCTNSSNNSTCLKSNSGEDCIAPNPWTAEPRIGCPRGNCFTYKIITDISSDTNISTN